MDKIIEFVENHPGCNGAALVCHLAKNGIDISKDVLDDLVEKELIIRVDYCLASMNYRIKSIYFPKNTSFYFPKNTSFHLKFKDCSLRKMFPESSILD